MSLIGNIGEYKESEEEFESYAKRFELFVKANSIDDALKSAAFLSVIGPKTFSLVTDLVSPEKTEKCTYDALYSALNKHYKPQTVVIYERFKFYKRVQMENESIAEFAAGIKCLARTCEFGTNLETMLRDKFVMGLKNESTQRVLLTISNLTYAMAYETASAREIAARDVEAFGAANANTNKSSTNQIHAISKKPTSSHNSKSKSGQSNFSKNSNSYSNKNASYSSSDKPKSPCMGCGAMHFKRFCKFKNAECRSCGIVGHLERMCLNRRDGSGTANRKGNVPATNPKKGRSSANSTNYSTIKADRKKNHDPNFGNSIPLPKHNSTNSNYTNSTISTKATMPYIVTLLINNISVPMELDTGAARTIMSYCNFKRIFGNSLPTLKKTSTVLYKYGKAKMPLVGEASVKVSYSKVDNKELGNFLQLLVVKENGPTLLGRDWLNVLNLSIETLLKQATVANSSTNNVTSKSNTNLTIPTCIDKMLKSFTKLFEPGLGTYTGEEVTIDVVDNPQPKFCKARPVPYVLKEKVDVELDRLLSEGIIVPINHSAWAAPIVPVLKPKTNTVRICGDFRLTCNKVVNLDKYPLPKHDELLSSLSGGKFFAKLDLSQAYAQLKIDEESQKYTVVNTHRGLFKYTRLSFGVSSAPAIFQRTMENLLRGLEGTCCFLDDILLAGSSAEELCARLKSVLSLLQSHGLRLNKDKCKWFLKEITYLGLRICEEGILPTNEKVEAINKMPAPTNVKELRTFLGMINFYRKFIPNASTKLEPLYRLLNENVSWTWNKDQQSAFTWSKDVLTSSKCLAHFDPTKPLVVTADSSSYGVGAVLSLKVDGKDRPICFASRTLSKVERNYSQTEKEALAIVFALRKFHFYLYGRRFTVVTDHRPLLGLFSADKAISVMASGRIQRWSLQLQAYSFQLVHKSGKTLGSADTLSRFPIPGTIDIESTPLPTEWINLVQFLDATPVTAKLIAKETIKDPILKKVFNYLTTNWPTKVESELKPYSTRNTELSVQDGCVLWGSRVVIPPCYRQTLLKELHENHVGSTRMKQLARSYFWYPGLDADLDQLVRTCSHCLEHRASPPHADLHPWEWPQKPWFRVHIDYCGPIKGHYFLVIIDAYSKYIEVFPTKSTTSTTTIRLLRTCFSRWGLPVSLVSDNGTAFTSAEFKNFILNTGIRHTTSAPHQKSTNGQAESAVKTFKDACGDFEGEEIQEKLDRFLFQYRITPHTTTGISPNELLLGRKVRSVFDLLHPGNTIRDRVEENQRKQKENYDGRNPRKLNLLPNEPIMYRNYGRGARWLPGTIDRRTGPVSFRCKTTNDEIVRRHLDQIIRRQSDSIPIDEPITISSDSDEVSEDDSTNDSSFHSPSEGAHSQPASPELPRRSKRTVRAPRRLNL